MAAARKLLVVLLVILATGLLRMPVEQALTTKLHSRGLLLHSLDVPTRARLGQTSAAVALGGLRTVVAAFENLRAHSAFQRQDWPQVDESFQVITTLAPRTVYYWQTGAWHLGTNAPAFYRNDSSLPPPRRADIRRQFILKGIDLLHRGIQNNPQSWELPAQLAALYDDPAKLPDIDAAATLIDLAVTRPGVPDHILRQRLYLIARHPQRQTEALAIARSLFDHPNGHHRVPGVLTHLYALERQPSLPPPRHSLDELFPNPNLAYQHLSNHWLRRDHGAPVHGIPEAIADLERILNIPPQQSILTHER
jgi:hypothetical protein